MTPTWLGTGAVTLTQKLSGIPTLRTYVRGRMVGEVVQDADLAGFVRSGGRRLHAVGQGNLAPASTVGTVTTPLLG